VWFWRDDKMLHSTHLSRELFTYLTYPFSAGREAVILFFILSGFVLSIPAINSRAQTYPVFITRRIFRIYFPYIVALLFAVWGAVAFHGAQTESQWLNGPWSAPITLHSIMQHIIFVGQFDQGQLNPPIWSLVYEMRISFLFPILCALCLSITPGQSLIMAVFMSGASIAVGNMVPTLNGQHPIIDTLHYSSLFVVGIYLARQRGVISKKFSEMSFGARTATCVLSVLLYVYAGVLWQGLARRVSELDLYNSADWLTAAGATGLIVFSLNSATFHRVLLWPPIHALGKMSYSVYLLHFIIMLALVHLLYGKVPLLIIFGACLVAVIAASWTFYRLVEVPFINLGRKLSGHF
jgi:peptidoglycan/LPS O-acetylase OafA/YrhL